MSAEPGPATLDRWTQTEPMETGQDAVSLLRRVQSLQLEDALLPEKAMGEGTRAKLHRVPGMEEEDEEQDDEEEGGREQEKELSWTSSVEEPIQPTIIRSLQIEDFQDGRLSPEEPGSASASVRPSDQNLSSRSGPLPPIQEGEKKPLCVISPCCPSAVLIMFCVTSDCMALINKSNLTLILTCVTTNPGCAAKSLVHFPSGCQGVIS